MVKKNPKEKQSLLVNFRRTFTAIIFINMAFLIERTIFDFMGFMFGTILIDLFYFIILVIGLFGAYQYRTNYVAAVSCIQSLFLIFFQKFIKFNYISSRL
jgi:hypothetical protein